MIKPNITPGPWTFGKQDGIPNHCMMAQVFDTTEDELYVATIRPRNNPDIANANAQAISQVPGLIDALIDLVNKAESFDECSAFADDEIERAKEILKKSGVQL